jgi:hypothetical protein
MKSILPEKVYVQCYADFEYDDGYEKCSKRKSLNDVEYIRADIAEKMEKELKSILIDAEIFVSNSIFNHEADAAPMHLRDYKIAKRLCKQLNKIIHRVINSRKA